MNKYLYWYKITLLGDRCEGAWAATRQHSGWYSNPRPLHHESDVLQLHCTFGRRAFSVAGPMEWNSLLDSLRDPARSTNGFRSALKTHLFATQRDD